MFDRFLELLRLQRAGATSTAISRELRREAGLPELPDLIPIYSDPHSGSVLSVNAVRLMEGAELPKDPLLEECPLADADSLKRHDWDVRGTYSTGNSLGINGEQVDRSPTRYFSLLRCQRCGKPVRVWE